MLLRARPRPLVPALLVVLFAALLSGAAACSSDAGDATAVKEITVTIAGKTVTPPPGRIPVTKGQTVRITVTADVADVVHVHGYDKAATLQPNTPATIEFVADQDGLFEVETHGSGLQLCQLAVE